MKINVNVLIYGKVQGVWFRASTKKKADEIGLTGWVKNRTDGCVEAVFEGEEKQVNKMINWCRQGPPLSNVKKIEIKNQKLDNKINGFHIKY
jgi:acylphosphatase